MKRTGLLSIILLLSVLFTASTCKERAASQNTDQTQEVIVLSTQEPDPDAPTVYFTSDISAAGLVRYGGNRSTTANHLKAIEERGYNGIATVDIMDSEGSIDIPVSDSKWIKYDRVGSHLQNYDFMINLAHFKGHAMGGFGGVLKNQSIGLASSAGKLYIHSAGRSTTQWIDDNQDGFLESMAAAAQAVHNYFKQEGKNIIYINVMNNMSVDCDCDGSPATPRLKDIGILSSTDPVALDQACLDLVFNHTDASGDDSKPLQERINRQHGTHITEYAEAIGLGTRKYNIKNIDSHE